MNAEEVESQKKEFWACFNVPRIAQKKNKKIKFALVLMAIGGQKKTVPNPMQSLQFPTDTNS